MKVLSTFASKFMTTLFNLKESMDSEEIIPVVSVLAPNYCVGGSSASGVTITELAALPSFLLWGFTISGTNTALTACTAMTAQWSPVNGKTATSRFYIVPSVANSISQTVMFPQPMICSGNLVLGADVASFSMNINWIVTI